MGQRAHQPEAAAEPPPPRSAPARRAPVRGWSDAAILRPLLTPRSCVAVTCVFPPCVSRACVCVCVCVRCAQAAAQFPQFHFQRSTITSTSLSSPSYIKQLAAFPLPASAQDCLGSLPRSLARAQCGHHLLAAVSSEHDVKLYNYRVGTPTVAPLMEHFGNLRGHTRAVHDVKFHNVHPSYECAQVALPEGGALMITTASEDGTIKVWDVRQQAAVMNFRHPKGKPFIACASAGHLLAGAAGPFFFLWDLRTAQGGMATPMAMNEDFHTEDINQLAFHPQDPNTILTGSEDGLICVIQPSAEDQDEWLQNVINIENPVSRFGFFGPSAQFLWALSTVETLSLWNIEECERLSDFAHIRDNLSRSANQTIDYLVDAHYDAASQRLFLAAGTNEGELVLSHINRTEIQPFCKGHVQNKPAQAAESSASSMAAGFAAPAVVSAVTGFSLAPMSAEASPFGMTALTAIGGPEKPAAASSSADGMGDEAEAEEEEDILKDGEIVYPGTEGMADDEAAAAEAADARAARRPIDALAEGHTATIRDVLWFDQVLITGGEDSRLCLWSTQPLAADAAAASQSSMTKLKQHSSPENSASPPAAKDSNRNNRQYKPY